MNQTMTVGQILGPLSWTGENYKTKGREAF